MKIKIFCFSDSDKHFDSAINEYKKRVDIEIINLKPIKWLEYNQTIQKETDEVIKILEKIKWKKILLSLDWKMLDSMQFSQIFDQDINFFIGWAYGFDETRLEKLFDLKICFWKLTFPHWLAKLVLLEQIYRANCIKSWKKYHY